ncbi:MAG: transcriptional regulator, partial [Alphaproteobacteria bacterium]|nr:transcriptional regulator [Alphaproteobacteria bacterium]
QDSYQKWWLIANGDTVDLCTDDPGRNVDIYLSGSLITLASIWMGDVSVKAALDAGQLELIGEAYLVNSVARWFPMSSYAHIRSKATI